MSKNILGISCFYHDSAAALVRDGKVVAAAQEERFSRIKHDSSFPDKAIGFCLKQVGIRPADLTAVAFYDKPFLKLERILLSHMDQFPRGVFQFVPSMRSWLGQKMWTKWLIAEKLKGFEGPIYFPEHHLSHAASAFLVSPFAQAAILTVDGVGEWATATRGFGRDTEIILTDQINYPDSLGLLYSAFTYYLGFKVNSGEYKIMGLAPYGKPRFVKKIRDYLIDIKDDGSFKLNLKYFAYPYGLRMTNRRFDELFGGPAREQGARPTQREMDLAASIQAVTNEVMVKMTKSLWSKYKINSLCMAGGVALNCVANSEILRKTRFTRVFVQPAAGDAGGAVGAAMLAYWKEMKKGGEKLIRSWQMGDVYWGPEFSRDEVRQVLQKYGLKYKWLSRKNLITTVAEMIAENKVVGWFQGRMEFGPRALGNRSILADARNPENQDRVNMAIKFRESFRPFAPSVLKDAADRWFDLESILDQYMLMVAQVKQQKIPAVTHVDGSARLHSVDRKINPLYYDLIAEFEKLTGVPVVINTSFNQRGEPIVCSPRDALFCFLRTNMDVLVMGNYMVMKEDVDRQLIDLARQEKIGLD